MTKEKRAYRVVGSVLKNRQSIHNSMSFEMVVWNVTDAAEAVDRVRYGFEASSELVTIASVNPK